MLGLNIDPAMLVAVAIFLVVGFPVHEFSHALAAYRLGDGTAKLFGRLTLNPLVHLDPMGSAILVLSALVGGFFIGWAKPTPINPAMLRGGRRAEAWVAAAGPLSNLAMAILAAIALRLMVAMDLASSDAVLFVANVVYVFIFINAALFIFNLIPIPPLDGSRVLYAFAPEPLQRFMAQIEPYGFFIIIGLVLAGGLGPLITHLNSSVLRLLVG